MAEEVSISELVPGVYILSSPFVSSKRGLIVDDTGSILIDTSISRSETQLLVDKALELDKPIGRIVLTDWHFDHSAWCELVPGAERIACLGAGEGMLSQHAQNYLATDPPEHPDLLKFSITHPTIELHGSATLHLQDRQLHLFTTPGHSLTHQSALLMSDGVLFAGDAIITCFPPVIQDGDSVKAVATHRRILEMDFNWLVPGHGPVLDRSDAKQHIMISLDYLLNIQAKLSKFVDPNIPLDDIKEAVHDIPNIFPASIEMIEEWHERAVLKIWDEQRSALIEGI